MGFGLKLARAWTGNPWTRPFGFFNEGTNRSKAGWREDMRNANSEEAATLIQDRRVDHRREGATLMGTLVAAGLGGAIASAAGGGAGGGASSAQMANYNALGGSGANLVPQTGGVAGSMASAPAYSGASSSAPWAYQGAAGANGAAPGAMSSGNMSLSQIMNKYGKYGEQGLNYYQQQKAANRAQPAPPPRSEQGNNFKPVAETLQEVIESYRRQNPYGGY